MSFKPGVFTSNATCTPADLELEQQLNAKLKCGRVVLWSMPNGHGMTFSYNGLSKTFMRRNFELDLDEVTDGLLRTAAGMQNARLRPGWTYDEDAIEQQSKDIEDATIE